tara:strand:- start:4221 stop:4409 length:189 start_codon:yes stop_codon:yes gene_type:complete
MVTEYYLNASRLTAKARESVVEGYHIVVEGITYELLDKIPRGRSRVGNLLSTDEKTRIVLYS